MRFTPQALNALTNHSWPGNVREMENLMGRLALTSVSDLVDVADLGSFIPCQYKEFEGHHLKDLASLNDMEHRGILAALERNNWTQSRAAKDLGITLRQMSYRVRKFGLERLVKQHRSGV